jgi:hypothetical protein
MFAEVAGRKTIMHSATKYSLKVQVPMSTFHHASGNTFNQKHAEQKLKRENT